MLGKSTRCGSGLAATIPEAVTTTCLEGVAMLDDTGAKSPRTRMAPAGADPAHRRGPNGTPLDAADERSATGFRPPGPAAHDAAGAPVTSANGSAPVSSGRLDRSDARRDRRGAGEPAGDDGMPSAGRWPGSLTQLAAQRQAARAAWRADPTLTGAALAARFGRQARWGREQIAAARREALAAQSDSGPVASGRPIADSRGMPLHGIGPHTTERGVPWHDNGTNAAPVAMPQADSGEITARAGAPAPAAGSPAPPVQPHRTNGRNVEQTAPPRALLGVTVISVALVTVVCAVVSYSHARHLAQLAGQGALAPWLPLAVDGLVAAATCSLLVDRRGGDRGHLFAWLGAGLGLAGSFGANLVAVDPTLVDVRHVRWVLAGYVPAALAISGHLLMRMLGDHEHAGHADDGAQ